MCVTDHGKFLIPKSWVWFCSDSGRKLPVLFLAAIAREQKGGCIHGEQFFLIVCAEKAVGQIIRG